MNKRQKKFNACREIKVCDNRWLFDEAQDNEHEIKYRLLSIM
jgi:hypothetical protein